MKKVKKPLPVFEVVFDGPGVMPEAIPLDALTQALSAIGQLASGSQIEEEGDETREPGDPEPTENSIALLDVVRGSAHYRFAGGNDAHALTFLRGVGRALSKPEDLGQNDRILNPIKRLSAAAEKMGCNIILREVGKDNGVLAQIRSDTYRKIAEQSFISGDTSFAGRVERVGGAAPMRCALRVAFQRSLLDCSVKDPSVMRDLGKCLYRDVAVSGEALWLKNTWKVVSFEIKSVSKLNDKPLDKAFEDLRNAGGSGWDGVDPKKVFEEVCG